MKGREWLLIMVVLLLLPVGAASADGAQGCQSCPCCQGSPDRWMPPPPPDPRLLEQHLTDTLVKLVDQGVISLEQADRISGLFRETGRRHQADMEKLAGMTEEERRTFMENSRREKPELIRDLIEKADLSEQQAKAVAEALRPPGPPPRHRN